MAATIGNIEGRIMLEVDGAKPFQLGTVEVPVSIRADGLKAVVSIPTETVKQALRDFAVEMADHLA
jgi:hypothetical protein